MTTTVTIEAHCADDKEVIIRVTDSAGLADSLVDAIEAIVLQDGETASRVVYDGRNVSVREQIKQ